MEAVPEQWPVRYRSLWLVKTYVVMLVVVPLAATLFALFAFSWYEGRIRDLMLFFVFYALGVFGVSLGYHRMLTHRSFEASSVLRAILLLLGVMAPGGDPLWWAATHVKHHAHADKEHDPHSPLDGLVHAHVGWIARADVYADPRRYVPHLYQDRALLFVKRTYFFWLALAFALPYLLGGWRGLLWGGFVRMFFTNHVTWSVNSICHLFGRRPFRTGDQSSNNWIVGLLGFGEGWHNNHHAFPQSAFHGLRPWQVDVSGYLLRGLARLGLIWNVRSPPPELMALKARAPARAAALG